VKALNGVQPFDWSKFLKERLDDTSEHAPLDGLTRGGYQLSYTETPSEWFKESERYRKLSDFSYSGGFSVGNDGALKSVVWYSPAYDAGLAIGTTIVAVNGRAFDIDVLKGALKTGKTPVNLLVRTGDLYRTVALNYGGGLRYPNLVKGAEATSLDALLAPKP
jgi:predicted metalloprotease with PDZ domain